MAPKTTLDTDLGTILRKLHLLTEEQVTRVVAHHKRAGLQFGQAAADLGFITPAELEEALQYQRRMRSEDPLDVLMEIVARNTEKWRANMVAAMTPSGTPHPH